MEGVDQAVTLSKDQKLHGERIQLSVYSHLTTAANQLGEGQQEFQRFLEEVRGGLNGIFFGTGSFPNYL